MTENRPVTEGHKINMFSTLFFKDAYFMVPEVKMVFFFFHIVVKSLNYEHAIWQAIYAAQFLLGGV